jgi:type 1 glutamine amidotransferase
MKSLKVLLVCDDLWHPAEVIEMGLAAMDHEELEFDIVKTAKDVLTPKLLQKYPVFINAKGNAVNASNSAPWFEKGVTECGPEEIREYVLGGGGFLALHAGLCIGRNDLPVYNELAGSYFIGHPPREMTYVKVTEHNELTEGVEDFCERDEHYQIAVIATDAKPFLLTQSEHGGSFVSGYTRFYGKGRVAALTPGHTLSIWENLNFQRLLKNTIRWCAAKSSEI